MCCGTQVRILLETGAVADIENTFGRDTPLHAAACFGRKMCVELLLQYGAGACIPRRAGQDSMSGMVFACRHLILHCVPSFSWRRRSPQEEQVWHAAHQSRAAQQVHGVHRTAGEGGLEGQPIVKLR